MFWPSFTKILVGFGWIWLDFYWILFDLASGSHLLRFWLDLAGFGLISVGFCLIWFLALIYYDFGWIWLDLL